MPTMNAKSYRTPPMEPVCLAIHLTYQCPLTCDHCCFSSNMQTHGHLSLEQVLRAIEEARDLPSIRVVAFTGGDPFLQRDILRQAIAHATAQGFATRVVTSAYWATTPEKAARALTPLAQAGLKEISLSFDDSHAEFVRPVSIRNAYLSARELGLSTAVSICLEPDCKITGETVRELLGADPSDASARLLIFESRITTTGRASDEQDAARISRRKTEQTAYTGPCPHVLRQPTITPSGKMLACCGTIPFREGLQIGDFAVDTVGEAVQAAFQNDVLKWIAFEGPVQILKQITADTPNPLTELDFDGICNACDVLFGTPEYRERLREALPTKLHSLRVQEAVYEGAGLYRPSPREPKQE